MKNHNYMSVYIATSMLSAIAFIFMLLIKFAGANISWFWVSAPLWMPSCIAAVILLIAFTTVIIKDKLAQRHYISKNLIEYFEVKNEQQ